jgi:hypothetical protein
MRADADDAPSARLKSAAEIAISLWKHFSSFVGRNASFFLPTGFPGAG